MSKYRFRSKCPACTNNDMITWHHVGCPDTYKEYIDQTGYVDCDCGRGSNIIFRKFNCGSYKDHKDQYLPFLQSRIYLLMAIGGTMNDDVPEDWRESLIDNIEKKWKETYGTHK